MKCYFVTNCNKMLGKAAQTLAFSYGYDWKSGLVKQDLRYVDSYAFGFDSDSKTISWSGKSGARNSDLTYTQLEQLVNFFECEHHIKIGEHNVVFTEDGIKVGCVQICKWDALKIAEYFENPVEFEPFCFDPCDEFIATTAQLIAFHFGFYWYSGGKTVKDAKCIMLFGADQRIRIRDEKDKDITTMPCYDLLATLYEKLKKFKESRVDWIDGERILYREDHISVAGHIVGNADIARIAKLLKEGYVNESGI